MAITTKTLINFSILLLICFITACSDPTPTITEDSYRVTEIKLADSPYKNTRDSLILITSDQLNLQLKDSTEVYGILMDWNMKDAIVTVNAFASGDASIYMSTGQKFVGGAEYEIIQTAAKDFVSLGNKHFAKAHEATKSGPPTKGRAGFYLLTSSGKYYLEGDAATLKDKDSPIRELFLSANKVITEYRYITE